jgi:hypothetical protein
MLRIALVGLIIVLILRTTFILHDIYIPDDYEAPNFYRFITIVTSLGGFTVRYLFY